MTNSPHLAQELSQRCDGINRHVILFNWKATYAEVYPAKLCASILTGIVNQLKSDGKFDGQNCLYAVCEEPSAHVQFYDDVTNQPLDPILVKKARAMEMAHIRET